MVDFDVNKSNIKNQEISAATAGSEEVSAPKKQPTLKLIFDQKMTRQQVSDEFGQAGLDIFDKVNKDGDDLISESEYNKAENNQSENNDIKGKSGKRAANGGVYVVQKGDTLSKIANDFGISVITLYQNNKKVIGDDINKIEIGMNLKISTQSQSSRNVQDEAALLDTIKKDDISRLQKFKKLAEMAKPKEDACIFAGMTRDQAVKRGGKSLEIFDKFSKGNSVITPETFRDYKKSISGISNENATQIVKDLLGEGNLKKEELKLVLDSTLQKHYQINKKFHSSKVIDISNSMQEAIIEYSNKSGDVAANSKELYKKFQQQYKDDIESDNGAYAEHYQRIKQGKLSDFEKKSLGLSENDELTDEQIKAYAKLATKAEYIIPVIQSLSAAVDGGDDDKIMVLVMNVGNEFFEDSEVKAVVEMYGMTGIVDEVKKRLTASFIAKNSETDFNEMDKSTAAMYTATIAENADAESFQVFAENHSEHIDLIKDVANIVIDSMDDGEKKTALINAINNAVQNIQNGSSSQSHGVNNDNAVGSAGEKSSVAWSSNPMTTQVYDTRQANAELCQEQGIVDYSVSEQAVHISANRIGTELGIIEPIRYNPDRVQKLLKDFNNSISSFDSLTSKEQQKVENYFTAAKPSTIVSIMVKGNQKVQQFLLKYVNTEAIAKNVQKDDIQNLIPQIQASLAEYEKLNVNAGIRKIDQMSDAEKYMYELNEKFS